MYKSQRICEVCGVTYRVKKSSQRFCSKSCAGKVRVGEKNTAFKHGVTTQGYRSIFAAGRRVLEHRHVMEQFLGRRLHVNEIVHHKDENKLNNSVDNLEVLTRKTHKDVHQPATFRSESHKQCRGCGKVKLRGEFSRKNSPGRDTHRPRCKECESRYKKSR